MAADKQRRDTAWGARGRGEEKRKAGRGEGTVVRGGGVWPHGGGQSAFERSGDEEEANGG